MVVLLLITAALNMGIDAISRGVRARMRLSSVVDSRQTVAH